VGSGQPSPRPDSGFFRIYNLGGSHPITLAEMIDAIANVVGKPARIKREPMQPGDVERTFADLSRSTKELEFHPTTAFVDGLANQWHAMRVANGTANPDAWPLQLTR
jgi:nucleoside-diphosphate-sugar epimerase